VESAVTDFVAQVCSKVSRNAIPTCGTKLLRRKFTLPSLIEACVLDIFKKLSNSFPCPLHTFAAL
jgi:hypothetical protein